jgi:hypothetical protein
MGLLGHRERLDQRVLDGLVLSDVPLADGVCDALEARVAVRQATQTLPTRLGLTRGTLLHLERHLARRGRQPLAQYGSCTKRYRIDGRGIALAHRTVEGPRHARSARQTHEVRLATHDAGVQDLVDQHLGQIHVERCQRGFVRSAFDLTKPLDHLSLKRRVVDRTARAPAFDLRGNRCDHGLKRRNHSVEFLRNLHHTVLHGASSCLSLATRTVRPCPVPRLPRRLTPRAGYSVEIRFCSGRNPHPTSTPK